MARSSRHKSSKHSSREARGEYSDSERKGKEEIGSSSGRHLKESEKRKFESKPVEIVKDSNVLSNVEFNDDHGGQSSSSRKRKEKVDDDRWTGADGNEFESLKSDSKRTSRKDENSGLGFDGEDGKRPGGSSRVESKHHSSRSERRERGEKEKERNGGSERKSSKSEKYVDIVMVDSDNNGNDGNKKQGNFGDECGGKHGVVNTDSKLHDDLWNSEPEKDLDRRVRRKRDGSGEGDRHQNGLQEPNDRRLSLRNDKSGRLKDDYHKDEKSQDKYREDADRDHSHQDEKQRDIWPSRDVASGKSDDKQVRNENRSLDVPQKKSKLHHSEYDRDRERDRKRDRDRSRDREKDHDRERDRDWELDRDQVRERDHDRSRVRDRDRGHHDFDCEHDKDHDDRDRERDHDRDLERSYDRDREPDRDRDRGRDRYRRDKDRVRDRDHIPERGRDREYDNEHDFGSYVDDKVARYKEQRGRRSPDGYVESHGVKERSLSRKPHVDSVTSNSRHRNSPSSRSYVSSDKYRDGIQDEMKYGDPLRDGAIVPEVDKVPKYRSVEKRAKFEDNHIAELPERSPSTKASPASLKERSPSTTSMERRYRSGRRSVDVDESERRSSGSNDMRDVPLNEDRLARDFSAKKPLVEDYPPAESLLYHKSSQGNVPSHGPSPSGFRVGGDSPSFIGSFGDENRGQSGSRYGRASDPNMGRGPNNGWKGVPNWPSPLPNGFMAYPPGPPALHHGGFPPMMSQFPPPFNVRPSLEMNHPGIPFHMADADRFSSHVRPIGWPNMVDGSVPPHFHGWGANNGVVRDEPPMFSQGNASSRGWDINPELWKLNGDMNMDVNSRSQKDARMVKASTDEASSAHCGSKLQYESSCLDDQGTSVKKNTSSGLSSAKDTPMTPSKVASERTPESFSIEDTAIYPCSYLAKLDISMDLSDPELYNQCINIGSKDQPEFFDEDAYVEEKSIEPEIINLNRGLTYFPAAKDSIFQGAMNLYKNLSTERANPTTKGTEPINPPTDASQLEAKESLTSDNAKQADPILVLSHEVPTTSDGEEKHDPEPVTSLLNEEVAIDGETVIQNTLVIREGITEENVSAESILKVAGDSNADVESSVDGKNGVGGSESGAEEYLDVKVSDEVVICHDSVKVCEAAMSPVSNESKVILTRIHHDLESTH